MASGGKDRMERIREKFKASVQNGKYYEASQMIRTLYSRYKAQKKYDEAEQLLYDSVLLLLHHNQHESGMELARLLLSSYKESRDGKSIEDVIDQIVGIIRKTQVNSTSRQDFMKEALGLTASMYKWGHPRLNEAIAQKYWEEKKYDEARKHFIYTSDGSTCASFLIEYHIVRGFPGEIDLFITQAVLQYLCMQQTMLANVAFYNYTDRHPGINRKSHPYKQPLLNFVAYLLLAIEKGTLEQFTILIEQYKPSICRDATYRPYLDKIGQIFFNLPPPAKKKAGIEGLFGDLMESFMGSSTDAVGGDNFMEEALD